MSRMPEFDKLMWGIVRTRLWRLAHNLVAHPLMEILPEKYGTALHDWTAQHMGTPASPEDVAQRTRSFIERLSPEALAFLRRYEGPITIDILRRVVVITDNVLN